MRHGVIGIARELERRLPDLVTTSWWKEERGERVFVDFNQACRDRTIASAYSPRPLPGAPVSMPVTWDELPTSARATSPCSPCRASSPTAVTRGPTSTTRSATSPRAIALWDRDVEERGLGELNFPPDYPKMPGEPPRVQPSKRRTDKADDEYMAPKAERDADLRDVWGAGRPAGRADARQAGQGHPDAATTSSSPSGTASARSSSAPATGSRSAAATRSR